MLWAMAAACAVVGLRVRAQLAVPANAVPAAAEGEAFGRDFERGFRAGDAKAMLARLDFLRLAERSLASLPGDPEGKRTFSAEFARGAGPSYEFGLRSFASFHFLRCITTNGQQTAVFRILLPDGSMNYHRYLLMRGEGGAVVADGHALASGEWFSDSIRRLYVLSESRRDPGFAARLAGAAADLARNAEQFEKVVGYRQKAKPVEFLDAYKLLPATLREDRVLLLMRIASGIEAEPLDLALALKDWARLYPDDPQPELLAYEKLLKRGENQRAATALARLEAGIGGDPHLQALQASLLARAGEVARARAMADAALRAEPGLPSAHDAVIAVALARRDYAEAGRLVDAATKLLGRDPVLLVREDPQFSAFRGSPEGRRWLSAHGVADAPESFPRRN